LASAVNLTFPEHDLTLSERDRGIVVQQHGREYFARKWQLTPEVVSIVKQAMAHGLTCLWQQGHPGGSSSHHISFSFSHDRASWVFCIGDGAGAPDVRKVTISKKVRGVLNGAAVDAFWESAGGKNSSITPDGLPDFLARVDKIKLRELLTAPRTRRRYETAARAIGYQLEKDLGDVIGGALESGVRNLGPQYRVWREARFPSHHFQGGTDVPDFVIQSRSDIVIVELKLYRGEEPHYTQLARYMANPRIRNAFGNGQVYGALVAFGYENLPGAKRNVSLYTYTDGTGLPLSLVSGADVLAPFLGKASLAAAWSANAGCMGASEPIQ